MMTQTAATVPANNRGFTLIEILIVILIISIVAGVAVISLHRGQHWQTEREARQMAAIIQLAEEEALLRPATLSMTVAGNSIQFSIQDTQKPGAHWGVLSEKIFQARRFSSTLILTPNARIIFSPDGTLTPFTLRIDSREGRPAWHITGRSTGAIHLEALHASP